MTEKGIRKTEPQPGFTEAAPEGVGTTGINVPKIMPITDMSGGMSWGNLRKADVFDEIQKEVSEKPWIRDILSGRNKRAAMIIGAGVITFLVGYEMVHHGENLGKVRKSGLEMVNQMKRMRVVRKALERRLKNGSKEN